MISSTASVRPTSCPEAAPKAAPEVEAVATGVAAGRVLDLRAGSNHPLALRYAEVHDQVVVRARFAHGRAQPGLAVDHATPFVIAARHAVAWGLERAGALDRMVEALADYYAKVQPADAAEWLGLDDPAPSALRHEPPWAAVFPWRARSVASYRAAYEAAALAENRAVGREVGIEDGWLFCGPVSTAKCRIEAERILFVLQRMAAQGYQRHEGSDGDVRATALVNEAGDWRWLITAGNHRASAAAALGLAEVPVRVNLVISRADVAHWPQVVRGVVAVDQALAVFDRYFDARPPAVAQAWATQTSVS